jgi:hypothetical protein
MTDVSYDSTLLQATGLDMEQDNTLRPKKPPHFHIYKKWTNTVGFRETGIRWEKDKIYCPFPEGSLAYNEFWDEEERRIREGYTVDGQRIAGLHYLYLNYCPIWNKKERAYKFPDFRAVDAEWFLAPT